MMRRRLSAIASNVVRADTFIGAVERCPADRCETADTVDVGGTIISEYIVEVTAGVQHDRIEVYVGFAVEIDAAVDSDAAGMVCLILGGRR
jgi:hypothetical protein